MSECERRFGKAKMTADRLQSSTTQVQKSDKATSDTAEQDERISRISETLSSVSLRNVRNAFLTLSLMCHQSEHMETSSPEQRRLSPPNTSHSPSANEKAKELASLYLPDDTAERRECFQEIYVATRDLSNPPADLDVLKAYFLFDGDVGKSVKYVRAMASLLELGFAEDSTSTALLNTDCVLDDALDYIIKQSAT